MCYAVRGGLAAGELDRVDGDEPLVDGVDAQGEVVEGDRAQERRLARTSEGDDVGEFLAVQPDEGDAKFPLDRLPVGDNGAAASGWGAFLCLAFNDNGGRRYNGSQP